MAKEKRKRKRGPGPYRDRKGRWRDSNGRFVKKPTVESALKQLAGMLGDDWDYETKKVPAGYVWEKNKAEHYKTKGEVTVNRLEYTRHAKASGDGLGHFDVGNVLTRWQKTPLFKQLIGKVRKVHVTADVIDKERGMIDGLPLAFAFKGSVAVSQAVGHIRVHQERYKASRYQNIRILFLPG